MARYAKYTVSLFFGLLVMAITGMAHAQSAEVANSATVEAAKYGAGGWIAIAAGFCLGLAAFGGAQGQGKAAAAALDGIARSPSAGDRMNTPLILSLALIESLVIYALVIAILFLGKIPG